MPAAARLGDAHVCPKIDPGPKPHIGGPILQGDTSVLIGNRPAARKGDKAFCVGLPDTIDGGEDTVLIGGKPAARRGDRTKHGGKIMMGCPSVIIGSTHQALTLKTDKVFCEECARLTSAED